MRVQHHTGCCVARGTARLAVLLSLALFGGCATLQAGPPATGGVGPAASVLDSIFADTAFSHAHIGALVVRARTGETLYARHAERVFVPASNQKLVTGAVALETLGPAFRFSTAVSATGQVRDGVLRGDLVVRGGGDPTLSGRFASDPRDHFRAWADSLRARGITRIEGGIVGVDSLFPERGLGAGWAWDDLEYGFAAEIGALQFNEGVVRLQAVPSRQVGAPPVVVVDPPTQHLRIYNLAATGPPGSAADLSARREEAGAGVTVEGTIPADTAFIAGTLAVRVGDFNGDGRTDIASISGRHQAVRWHENLGPTPGDPDGAPAFATHEIFIGAYEPSALFIADIDQDGRPDILTASRRDDSIRLHRQIPVPEGDMPVFVTERITSGAKVATGVCAADIDGDGELDIVSASSSDDAVRWYRNDRLKVNRVTFAPRVVDDEEFLQIKSVGAGDFDNDGRVDLCYAATSAIRWLRNLGDDGPTFERLPVTPVGASSFFTHVHPADMDGDGRVDLLATAMFGSSVRNYMNTGAEPRFSGYEVQDAGGGRFVAPGNLPSNQTREPMNPFHATTILCVRRNGRVAIGALRMSARAEAGAPIDIIFPEEGSGWEAEATAIIAGFFLDDVAEIVETRDYPGQGAGQALPLVRSAVLSVKFFGVVILGNLAALALLGGLAADGSERSR